MAAFMWLISRAVPAFHFDVPVHNWLAVVLVLAGFVTGISGVVTFRQAKTTVNPMKPHASALVTWGVWRRTWPIKCALDDGCSSRRVGVVRFDAVPVKQVVVRVVSP
jgi:hypothetical protein